MAKNGTLYLVLELAPKGWKIIGLFKSYPEKYANSLDYRIRELETDIIQVYGDG